ncbi:TPA: hypothetical protein N0F65_001781 [Lagenidium giganteum]|uniref:Polycystin cation channel PKD1/PKD2 domain-containing protein n=1 Tax=Lagenidium giganteum TaxID=4803 RepID=A0AAV2Z4Q3_9STRA|nr:TPA: hypothetical protein N0F65_001781 [Lagenidium giganteum]
MALNEATFFILQAVAAHRKARGTGGSIVNVGSMWAKQAIKATPSSAYSMAKAGLHALTQHAAMELADDHIRVNAVAPAVVKTPIYGAFIEQDKLDATMQSFDAFHPIGRVGTPEDVATTKFRDAKKRQQKVVIIQGARKRATPHVVLRENTKGRGVHSDDNKGPAASDVSKESPNRRRLRLSRFFPAQVKKNDSDELDDRPENWAALKIRSAMRRHNMIQVLSANRMSNYLSVQCKNLFDECCKCYPLAHGPAMKDGGVLQLAGPNLPKILRILRSKKNAMMDLLQPHGIGQLTCVHVAAQRGYVDLVRELMTHWTENPLESPYQTYSLKTMAKLLVQVRYLRQMKTTVAEYNSELRLLISELGVSFAHFSESMDRLHDSNVGLDDLLKICGHPMVLCHDAAGNTPLHYAAEGGYLALCSYFIEYGANINEQNKAGETPLHFAISSRHTDVCEFFVQQKADVNLCRYVTLTLLNDVTLHGTFIDAPDANAVCQVMPVLQSRSNVNAMLAEKRTKLTEWFSPSRRAERSRASQTSAVTPEALPSLVSSPTSLDVLSATDGNGGMSIRVANLHQSSPIFRERNQRDIVYFRTAPGNALMKPNILCVFLIGEHVAQSEVMDARELQSKGKLLHLLIRNMPEAALLAMDSFRTPLFRCNILNGVREYNQRWIVDTRLRTAREKNEALLLLLKTPAVGHSGPAHGVLVRIRHVLSVQNAFMSASTGNEDNIICDPKGILYEYVYDNAELRGGLSPTLELIIRTEHKELINHPWVNQLMDHKWNSFARQTFRQEFHVYFTYFVSFFIATYLHVGDTMVGMPAGGYRSMMLTKHSRPIEYVRDTARLTYLIINAYYTVQEYRSYKEVGSLRAYFRDGWNWFDTVQISCVWMLLLTEIAYAILPDGVIDMNDYDLIVFQESLYNTSMWRRYNLRTTLMSIVGPQIFIKWIQFARGNRVLGPFVRMIFKMFRDISVFLVVFSVFMVGFAFSFFILQLEGYRTLFGSITSVFQMSLGAWDWSAIYEGGPIAVLFFLIYAIIGTIMLLNLLIAMLGNTYDKVWEDRLLFFALERAKATLSIQTSFDDDDYDEKFWCQRLYVLEGDRPIEGIQFKKF